MSDKKKIVILSLIIGFVVVLIILVGIIAYLSFVNENKNSSSKLSTTTRRTVDASDEQDATSKSTTQSTTTSTQPVTSSISPTTSKTNSTNSTTKTTTKKKTTTSKKTTTTKRKTTTKASSGGSIIPIPDEREVTYESTDYPNADDEGAWNIVDMINAERTKNGLKPVEVAVELRRLAEEAADFWYEYSDDEIKNYLYGHSNYRRKSNHLYTNSAYLSMYEATIKNTKVTTDKNLKYIGVGLIYRVNGIGGLATHYYVIIYE